MSWSEPAPVASIVVPTFDDGALLRTCLQSVSSQDEQDFECIVVDDGSASESATRIASEFFGDPRFYYLRNPTNIGLAASRNVGLERAKGSFITFLDADDLLFPKALSTRLAAIRDADDNGSLGGSFCNWVFVPEGQSVPPTPPKQTSRRNITWLDCVDDNVFIASAPLISTETARAVGGFDVDLSTAEDYDFWSRYLRHGYALRPTAYVGVGYRQKRSSMFRRTTQVHVETQISIYEWNYKPLNPEDIASGTPHVFTEPPGVYRLALNRTRRSVVGVVTALHSGDRSAIDAVVNLLKSVVSPWMWWATNWKAVVAKTAERLEAYDDNERTKRTQALIWEALEVVVPILRGGPSTSRIWPRERLPHTGSGV